MKRAAPFLKWAGGKRQLLKVLRPLYPSSFKRYHEPFLGGGAVFFDIAPRRAVLSDSNRELVDCYIAVRDQLDDVIQALSNHKYNERHYYKVRKIDPASLSLPSRAARTIYLNRSGFNGLYRVNSSGVFNVPFGKHKNPTICNKELLEACSERLMKTELRCCSFEEVLDFVKKGDFVYFDPPYFPISKTSKFTAYQMSGFGSDRQKQLAEVFCKLTSRGVKAMLSNSDVEEVREMYEGFNMRVLKASRTINSVVSGRGPVCELVVTNYED